MREKQMMILMKGKKPNENTNVTEILSLESVPFSTLHSPIPFWGIVKWRFPLCKKKKKDLNFKFFFLFLLLFLFLKVE